VKKSLLMLLLISVVAMGVFVSGCGGKDLVTGGTGLPDGWRATIKSIPDMLFNDLHVNETVIFYTAIYDENNQEVSDYDTSSTTWDIEPADAGTLTDTNGTSTHFTATRQCTVTLKWRFKGTSSERPIEIKP
jgi:hypothetical protein